MIKTQFHSSNTSSVSLQRSSNAVRVFYEGIDMTHYFAYKLKKI